jgi:hypothetical protein
VKPESQLAMPIGQIAKLGRQSDKFGGKLAKTGWMYGNPESQFAKPSGKIDKTGR